MKSRKRLKIDSWKAGYNTGFQEGVSRGARAALIGMIGGVVLTALVFISK